MQGTAHATREGGGSAVLDQVRDTVLEVEGLAVSYGALRALDGVSWRLGRGEILGIIGPNGAGKSTCYDAVTNLVAREGRVVLKGEDVTRVPAYGLAERGLRRAFQQNAFFDDVTVLDNMVSVLQDVWGTSFADCLVRPFRERRRTGEARRAAAAALERLGIAPLYHDRYPTEVPYGTQRMLSIALALGSGAEVLMLDEPAAGLGGADMEALVVALARLRDDGLSLVVIEHHMDLIMSVADRIVVLDQGRMLAHGTPAEIQENDEVLDAYLGRAA
ncbi:ATP-binding cassette domain-containing protein [Paralimibaculum aggregatum]|uniref:ATP-binding cassette domain-containing protein n=1 Tax=Paralimibaculum aggregatum TaxID=3036245 RepID=A0ABQ6LNZ6_9RHOB|nr:ATP-binding cassette domain-containing protein [Limibaculum sp. NKW23]GMG84946.1 ATP-binding cassette domain-containing protein [Limibaculum sp. NKW23]